MCSADEENDDGQEMGELEHRVRGAAEGVGKQGRGERGVMGCGCDSRAAQEGGLEDKGAGRGELESEGLRLWGARLDSEEAGRRGRRRRSAVQEVAALRGS